MPEQPEGGQKKELHPHIKEYFRLRHLDYNQIPPHTYDALANFPAQHMNALVDTLNAVGQGLEADTEGSLDEPDEGADSDAPVTALEKYRFVIH
jgi:hypothetical protein